MPDIKTKILIVDDEPQIRKLLKISLGAAGEYKIEEATSGREAVQLTASIKPEIIILDMGLPDIDGMEVIREIRKWSSVPIIVLSVRSEEKDIVNALDLGANDYLTKPFNVGELLARMRVAIRNKTQDEGAKPVTKIGDIELDFVKHTVKKKGEKVDLSVKEYNLFAYLVKNQGLVVTQHQLLKEVWGVAHSDDAQYLRVYIGQLREKLEDDRSNPQYIITESGIGYRLVAPE